MSNSLFIPVRRLPTSLDELQEAVNRAFDGFNIDRPDTKLHLPKVPAKSMADSIITVRGTAAEDHCWISFGEYPTDLTGSDMATQMGDVTTRGSWLFAAVVVVALFEFGGSTVFNDSGELDGRPEYDAASLRRVVDEALISRCRYLSR